MTPPERSLEFTSTDVLMLGIASLIVLAIVVGLYVIDRHFPAFINWLQRNLF